MKIEPGKCYRTRDGRKVGPIGYNPNITNYWKFFSGVTFWDEFGRLYKATRETDLDLIAEWTEDDLNAICEERQDGPFVSASDAPKTWGEMTDAEKGALLLAHREGKAIEFYSPTFRKWMDPVDAGPSWFDVQPYRIKPEPVRETVTKYYQAGDSVFDTHRITFTTTDGKPDLDSIKMEEV